MTCTVTVTLDGSEPYAPGMFGAVWDGQSHPLSERYATLAEAQAVYPHAEAMTDEIDWCATQAAINQVILDWDAHGARYGGVVLLPPGVGRFNRALCYPANDVWAWKDQPVVCIRGQGRTATTMQWRSNDPLPDGYALTPKKASAVDGTVVWSGDSASLHSDCMHSGFTMAGPGNWRGWVAPTNEAEFIERYGFDPDDWATAFNTAKPEVGQVYETYGGISAGERTSLEDLFISGFHAGINLRGGQKFMRNVMTHSCYFGLYGTFTPAAHGDMLFQKCNFGARWAAFGMAPDYAFYGHMDTCFLGGAPYAFYKEGGGSGGGHFGDFACGVLTHCQFESVGNSIFAEANATRRHELRDLTLQNCIYREVGDHSFPVGPGITGPILRDALIDAKSWKRVSILRSHDPDRWTPRDAAIFRGDVVSDVRIDSADGLIAAAGSKPVFAGNDRHVLFSGDGWNGYENL